MSPSNYKITELNLIKFGKFKNKRIDLNPGMNVIYGYNESGKSTIQLFIKAMLYGLPSRKKKEEALKERERAIPWDETRAEGMMKLEVDGRKIEIRRRIGKIASGDKTEVCDSITGEVLTEFGNSVGEELLGIPSGVFEKTLWIGQGAIPIGGSDESLAVRLMNIHSSGDEEVSAEAAFARLDEEKRKLKAKNGRNNKGRIDLLIERRENCVRRKYDLETQLKQTENIRIRLAEALKEKEQLESELAVLDAEYKMSAEAEKLSAVCERLARVEEFRQKIDEINKSEEFISAGRIEEKDIDDAFAFEREISLSEGRTGRGEDYSAEEAEASRKKAKVSMMSGVGVVLSIVSVAAGIAALLAGSTAFAVVATVGLIAGLSVIIAGIKSLSEYKNIIKDIDCKKQKGLEEERNNALREEQLKNDYALLLAKYNAASAADIQKRFEWRRAREELLESHMAMLEGFLGGMTYEALKKEASAVNVKAEHTTAEIEERLTAARERMLELVAEIKTAESKMAYQYKIDERPADIDTEIEAIEREICDCRHRFDMIESAEEALREAGDVFRMSFAPVLCNKVNAVAARLTGDKHSDIKVSEDYHMRVGDGSNLYDAEYFSFGTYEQLYLALRISVAELICGDTPIYLDDILTSFDKERAFAALEYLAEEAEKRQVVLFTCHESDKTAAESMNAHIINLN